jgi:hypothetical protein
MARWTVPSAVRVMATLRLIKQPCLNACAWWPTAAKTAAKAAASYRHRTTGLEYRGLNRHQSCLAGGVCPLDGMGQFAGDAGNAG